MFLATGLEAGNAAAGAVRSQSLEQDRDSTIIVDNAPQNYGRPQPFGQPQPQPSQPPSAPELPPQIRS